ncbi:MAG: helix-turn-helix transcriptional regulator [Bdellovibrionales bacterium]
MTHEILRLHEVVKITGRSRSSIYADMAEGAFPAPISLGARAVGWLKSDVNSWIENKISARTEIANG